jgi:hypothetical protein
VDTFLIHSATGDGSLEFFNRLPLDTGPIEEFSVRITEHDLFAVARVWAGYMHGHPADLFARMSREWTGWKDALEWSSLESELKLNCSHDGLGHIAIQAQLRSGPMDWDWVVQNTIMAEAGQLETLARHAARFFGQPR